MEYMCVKAMMEVTGKCILQITNDIINEYMDSDIPFEDVGDVKSKYEKDGFIMTRMADLLGRWSKGTSIVHSPATCPQCRAKAATAKASPIEVQFWAAYQQLNPRELRGLVREYKVGPYRIDFALPRRKIGIELDGYATHSSTADIANDRRRQRALEARGWYIIRFGGAEVYRDANGCIREAARLMAHR